MRRNYTVKLDTARVKTNTDLLFYISDLQSDRFTIIVTEKGQVLDLSGFACAMIGVAPSNKVSAQYITEQSSNVLTIVLQRHMMNEVGQWKGRLLLFNDEMTLVLDQFGYIVQQDELKQIDDDVEDDDRTPILTQLINQCNNILVEEEARVAAEQSRVNAEIERANNEQARIEEFTAMVNTFNVLDDQVNATIEQAQQDVNVAIDNINASFNSLSQSNAEQLAAMRTDIDITIQQAQDDVDITINTLVDAVNTEIADLTAVENAVKDAEVLRVTSEQTREDNEAQRQANESIRENNETTRAAAELDRQTQEDKRVSNEAERVSNENTRKANEVVRENNEATRQNTFTNKVDEVDKKIVELNTTKDDLISTVNTKVDNKVSEIDKSKNDMTTAVDNKIDEIENRFNALTSSQQQASEVIDARVDFKGAVFGSLKERIDYTDKLLRDSTVSTIEIENGSTTVEATSNGYFDDVKLEGKTLVNLIPNPLSTSHFAVLYASISDNVISFTADGTSRNLAMKMDSLNLKPSTEYTMIVKIVKNTVISSDKAFRFASDGIDRGDAYLTVIGGQASIEVGEVGTKIIPMITREEGNYITSLMGFVPVEATSGEISFKICLLEGDHTQNPPSYFEGLKSVGDATDEIVVLSVKGDGNLFDGELEVGTISANNGENANDTTRVRSKNFILVNNKSVTVSHNDMDKLVGVFAYDKNFNYLGWWRSTGSVSYSNEKMYYVKISLYEETNLNAFAMVNIGDTPKPYTPHQSDKKRLLYYNNETQSWEKPILHQWDSIEKHADGKYYYHQRSGEVVLNGSESWNYNNAQDGTNTKLFSFTFNGDINGNTSIISDKFKNNIGTESNWSNDIESIYVDANKGLYLRISTSKLSTQDVEGFKQWLQANNVTVVYQLAEEKVYECTNIDLITYANETNYIVECGAIVPKTTLKVLQNATNIIRQLQEKVSILEQNDTKFMQIVLDIINGGN